MQPAILDLTLHRGNDCRVRFLFQDGEGDPLPVPADELSIELTWSRGGSLTVTGDDLTVNESAGTALWEPTAEQTEAFPQGRVTRIELIRTNVADGRRTYGVGKITATDGEAMGDLDVGVTVQDLTVEITVTGGVGGGAGSAAQLSYDDTLTILGVDNVQDAIVALYDLIANGQPPSGGGALDFSHPANSALIGAL